MLPANYANLRELEEGRDQLVAGAKGSGGWVRAGEKWREAEMGRTRIGAQTQRPLAIVVIGGALAIMLLTRVLQPALIYLCHRDIRRADEANRTLAGA